MDRREWLQLVAAVAALEPLQAQRQGPPEAPRRITKEMLAQALRLAGLEVTDEHQDMMLGGVNRNLAQYENLRKIDVPLDTEPAFRFLPHLPGKAPKPRPARFFPTRLDRHRLPAFHSPDDLAFLSVTDLGALLRARRISSVELTEMYLARLKRHSPQLNCVITLTEERALASAKRADAEIHAGKHRGPLHGIPWGAKDLFATKGIPTTWGAEPYREQMIPYDATVVEKLDKAGAVLVAKLSMGALAMGGLWFGGMTKTPWNTEQTSSGSSAGSASATSAGLVGFSLGTETLGSIVTPSTRCGVTGLRPTYGRISRYGAMGLSWTMDKVGPICRYVEDCALVLSAIHGPDGHDDTVVDAPVDWNPRQPLGNLRVGLLKKDLDRAQGEDRQVYDKALADLEKAGVKPVPVEFPEFDSRPLGVILSAEAAAAFDDLTRSDGVNQLRAQGQGDWPNSFRTARTIPAVEYLRAQRARTLLMREMDKFMEQWDVFVGPPGSSLQVTNLTGHPQVLVPCGFVKGMPRGLLFTGRVYDEGTMLRVALAYERATKWHTMRPAGFGPDATPSGA